MHIELQEFFKPDSAKLVFTIQRTEPSVEAAVAARDAEVQRVTEALTGMGIDRSKITVFTEVDKSAAATDEASNAGREAAEMAICGALSRRERRECEEQAAAYEPTYTREAMLEVILSDLTLLERVMALGGEPDMFARNQTVIEPFFHQSTIFASDPEAARRAAISEALTNARSEADVYAEALGYRVLRIERVANREQGRTFESYIRGDMPINGLPFVEDVSYGLPSIIVEVDYILVPK